MAIIPFHGQWYSDIIVYDERKKYFYMWARKNRPLLDDEIRNMNLALVDQTRRSMQKTYGDVGSPTDPYSKASSIGANNAFKILSASVSNGGSGTIADNFLITGGASIENPAVLFVRGFYVFLTGDIEYINQGNIGSLIDKNYTETPIPDLTASIGVDRVDIAYIDLHFSEASATQGSNRSEYQDLNLKNPIVGTETANRARAVFDVRVWEDWRFKHLDGSPRSPSEIVNLRVSEEIFNSNDFLGSVDTDMASDPNPINKHYRAPIAIIYRRSGIHEITDADIVNLIDLYDKRILSLQEITYRLNHGGYTQRDVDELNLTSTYAGFTGLITPRYPDAVIDEGAYATGANNGLGSEAFNSNSVTPRILDSDGKFGVESLLVGRDGVDDSYPVTAPEQLSGGELIAEDISAKSIYVGYDKGVTGVREYTDRVNINAEGLTGSANALSVINKTGETGVVCVSIITNDNFTTIDYKGRHGINTSTPGWTGPDAIWDTDTRYTGSDAVNIAEDINASARISQHLFVEKESYTKGDSYGPSWKIPGLIDREHPALLGFTGMPRYGITGSPASVQVVPGVAVKGVTGALNGYTGTYGFYESYDADGSRVFTIGSKGDNFDRQVQSLYGTSLRDIFRSDADFMNLTESLVGTPLESGDTITYNITLLSGPTITRSVTVSADGLTGLYEVVEDINDPSGGGFYRTFSYQYAKTQEYGETGPIEYYTYTGAAFGAAINYEDPDDELFLRLLVKSMPEIDLPVDSVTLTVDRSGYDPLLVDFIKASCYGSSQYGGDVIDLRFVKFDLGDAADAFLFNGDVYFNGGGLLNKVTFSPVAIFRDDIYVYGKVVADTLLIQLAKFVNLQVDRDAQISEYLSVVEGAAIGYGPYAVDGINMLSFALSSTVGIAHAVKLLVNGGIVANNLNLSIGAQEDYSDFGVQWNLKSTSSENLIYVLMNGTSDNSSFPFGIHFKDNTDAEEKYGLFVIDGSDIYGDSPTPYNVLVWIKGDLRVGEPSDYSTGAILAKRLTLGLTANEVDNQYILSLKSGTAYIDNLTVNSIQFDATNPTSAAFFTNPQNIIVVKPITGDVSFNKNEGITRRKEFSFDTFTNPPAVMINSIGSSTGDGTADYEELKSSGAGNAVWANDTLSFTKKLITKLSENRGDDTVTTADFNVNTISGYQKWEHFRNNFSRIIVANLGTLKITWAGYDNTRAGTGTPVDGEENISISDLEAINGLKEYKFSSSLFKSSPDGNNVFDWKNPTNNFVTNIRASFDNSVFSANVLYNLNKVLGIFIPINSWNIREIQRDEGETYYERIFYYPYAKRVLEFNVTDFTQQYPGSNPDVWQAALYPRIIQQRMYSVDTQNLSISSTYKIYEALWNVDVVVYPVASGNCNNLAGDLLISYM